VFVAADGTNGGLMIVNPRSFLTPHHRPSPGTTNKFVLGSERAMDDHEDLV